MRIGSTPTHVFTLPFNTDVVDVVQIIYKQGTDILLELDESDCEMTGNTISTVLTQEDTFLFTGGGIVDIQLRVKTTDGTVLASNIMRVSAEQCLSDEVI